MRSPLARRTGRLLADRRKAKGLGQADVAKACDTTQPTVSRWELGWATPDLATLVILADLLGFSLDDLREVAA